MVSSLLFFPFFLPLSFFFLPHQKLLYLGAGEVQSDSTLSDLSSALAPS